MQSHESLLKQIYDIQLNNLCGIFCLKSNLMSDGGGGRSSFLTRSLSF